MTRGEGGLFDHLLKEDFRHTLVKRCKALREREEYEGVLKKGLTTLLL